MAGALSHEFYVMTLKLTISRSLYVMGAIPPLRTKDWLSKCRTRNGLHEKYAIAAFSERKDNRLGCGYFAYNWKLPAYNGAFLLTVENFAFFAYSWSFFAYSFSFFTYSWSFFSGKVRLTRALRGCKQRSLTVGEKAPTVSKKASPQSFPGSPRRAARIARVEKRPTSHRDSDPRTAKFLEKTEKFLPGGRPQIPPKRLKKY